MNRKEFLKSTCGLGICSCAGLSLITSGNLPAAVLQSDEIDKTTPLVPVDSRQIKNVLCYIDSSMDESVKKSIFERLGAEHLTHPDFINYINETKKNLRAYFDRVNSNKDTYWEKIEYNLDDSTIKITGKLADRCACSYAECEKPPLSLCNYCCIGFQKTFFEMLLEKPVTKVQLDESLLLGGKRCSSTIFVDGKIKL